MKRQDKNQDVVAKACDVSQAAVSKWTTGTVPNGEMVARLADLFGVSADYLLGRADKSPVRYTAMPEPTGELHDQLREIHRSDPESFSAAKSVIETLYRKTPRGRRAIGVRVKSVKEAQEEQDILDAASAAPAKKPKQ